MLYHKSLMGTLTGSGKSCKNLHDYLRSIIYDGNHKMLIEVAVISIFGFLKFMLAYSFSSCMHFILYIFPACIIFTMMKVKYFKVQFGGT